MPRNPKLLLPNSVILLTSRVQEGLPFVATAYMELILWGILGRAQELYPVRVCHMIWMSNHVHLIMVVRNPDDVPAFMRFVKGESATAVNLLLGRRARNVWCEGSDEPTVLTPQDVIRYIVYLYANPLKARLVRSIDSYPGVNTWKMYLSGRRIKKCRRVPRPAIPALPDSILSEAQQFAFCRKLKRYAKESFDFELEPDAWMECFTECADWDRSEIKKQIIQEIRSIELELQKQPRNKFIGADALRMEDIRQPYQPKKFGRRTICISSDRTLRRQFIEWAKDLFRQARDVFRRWKEGDYSLSFPPGMFPPSMPKRANFPPRIVEL